MLNTQKRFKQEASEIDQRLPEVAEEIRMLKTKVQKAASREEVEV